MATLSELDRRMALIESGLNRHLLDCAAQNAETAGALKAIVTAQATLQTGHGEIMTEIGTMKSAPWRMVRWIGGLVIASAITVLAENAFLHNQAQQTANQTAVSAATAAKAATATNAKISSISPQ